MQRSRELQLLLGLTAPPHSPNPNPNLSIRVVKAGEEEGGGEGTAGVAAVVVRRRAVQLANRRSAVLAAHMQQQALTRRILEVGKSIFAVHVTPWPSSFSEHSCVNYACPGGTS